MNNNGGDKFDEQTALTIVWIVLLVIFLVFPCCSTSRRRKIWRKRIKERRWDVDVPEEEPDDWFLAALERYQAAQQRQEEATAAANRRGGAGSDSNNQMRAAADMVWKEKEGPELRRILEEDLLFEYTKELKSSDFVETPTSSRSQLHDAETEEPKVDDRCNDDIDVELGVSNDENDVPQNEEEFDVIDTCRVRLPVPGGSWRASEEGAEGRGGRASREVPNGCAICMDPFSVCDRICWSSNAGCPHAFHEKCVVDWLLVLGRRRRVRMLQSGSDCCVDLTDYDMLCPCCRQDFVRKTGISDEEERPSSSQGV